MIPCSAIVRHEGRDHCTHGFILFPACHAAGDGDLSRRPYKGLPCCDERLSLGRAGCDESGKPTFERWRKREELRVSVEQTCLETKGAKMTITDTMVNRFLTWPLPDSVCADLCATKRGAPHRTGTNLLSFREARQMLEHILADTEPDSIPTQQAALEQAAREWLIGCGFCHRNYDGELTPVRADVDALVALLAAQRAAVLEEAAKIAKDNTFMSKKAAAGGDFGGPASCEYGCGDVIAELLLKEA